MIDFQSIHRTTLHCNVVSQLLSAYTVRSPTNWKGRENLTMATPPDKHYSDVITSTMASPIIGISIICTPFCSGADQRKYQSSASLAFGKGIHRWLVFFPTQRASNAENVSIWWRHHGIAINAPHSHNPQHNEISKIFLASIWDKNPPAKTSQRLLLFIFALKSRQKSQ